MNQEIADVIKNTHTTITFSTTLPMKLWLKRMATATGKSVSEICGEAVKEFANSRQKK